MSQICKVAITRKIDALVAKTVKARLTEICMSIFALVERLPISAILCGGKMNANCKPQSLSGILHSQHSTLALSASDVN